MESLVFSMYNIMPYADGDSFTSAFIIQISFSSLIAMARTSKTMLNNSGKSGHPCFVPDLRGNAFIFPLSRMMFAVGFLCIPFLYGFNLFIF